MLRSWDIKDENKFYFSIEKFKSSDETRSKSSSLMS